MSDKPNTMRSKNEQLASDVLLLTKGFIKKAWCWERDWCFSMLADDCTCIWPDERSPRSRQEIIEMLSDFQTDDTQVECTNIEVEVKVSCWPLCIATAQYLISTNPSANKISAQTQRVTFVWASTDEGIRLKHAHVSIPMKRRPGEHFYTWLGRENYAYVQAVLNHERKSRLISFRDTSGDVHWVMPEDVVYVVAHRQYAEVKCKDQCLVLRRGIGSICDARSDLLVRVHRSYAVNPMHLRTMEGNVLHLNDGTTIEVPRKRLAQVRRALTDANSDIDI